jgi:hypothetical protein
VCTVGAHVLPYNYTSYIYATPLRTKRLYDIFSVSGLDIQDMKGAVEKGIHRRTGERRGVGYWVTFDETTEETREYVSESTT